MKKYVKYSSLIFASVLLSYSTANAAAISVSSDISLKTTANVMLQALQSPKLPQIANGRWKCTVEVGNIRY